MKVALTDKVVIVTGAASGIGRAIASRAAASGAAGLLLVDLDAAGLEETAAGLDGDVALHVADLAGDGAGEAAVAACLDRFGRVDGLVNAAALTDRASVTDGTAAAWDRLFAVNARAPFFLMQATVRDMLARGAPGAIVNILSVNAHCGAPDLAIYSATKGALMTLTRNAAHAHLPDRIRVNGINLGWAETAGEHRMQTETLGRPEDWAEAAGARMPLGRLIQPEEAARHTVWLLSEASAPLTGTMVELEQKVQGAPGRTA